VGFPLALRRSDLAWLAAYLLALTLVVAGALYARARAIAVYGTPAAQAEWDAWRAEASKLAAGPGPVKRRPPKRLQPPALMLARDYFGVCLMAALVLTTVLFGTFAFLVRGMLSERR
jgi:hypothetical protein